MKTNTVLLSLEDYDLLTRNSNNYHRIKEDLSNNVSFVVIRETWNGIEYNTINEEIVKMSYEINRLNKQLSEIKKRGLIERILNR